MGRSFARNVGGGGGGARNGGGLSFESRLGQPISCFSVTADEEQPNFEPEPEQGQEEE